MRMPIAHDRAQNWTKNWVRHLPKAFGLAGLLAFADASFAQNQPVPPLPSDLPAIAVPTPPPPVINRRPRAATFPPQVPAAMTNNYRPAAGTPGQVSADILAFDALSKDFTAQPGEVKAAFFFSVTNVSKTNVVINWVRPSCGCTAAKLPPTPWMLAPGDGGTMEFDVDLRGKYGVLSKYVTVDTSHGQKMLNIKVNIPAAAVAAANPAGGEMDSRAKNIQLAAADRQVVFRGDCAKCHAEPVAGRTTGESIYQAACAICHDAPHRATMVPDLRATAKATGKDYWAFWITHGKAGTLMPAFAKNQGGPLTDAQIATLAEYMDANFPKVAAGAAALPTTLPALPLPPNPARPAGGGK